NETVHQLVMTARNEEIFRSVVGRIGSPQFVNALMAAYATGNLSLFELRVASFYLEVKDGKLTVVLGFGTHLFFVTSILLVIFMGVPISFLLLKASSASQYVTSLLFIGFYFLFSWFVGKDIRPILIAKRVSKKLQYGTLP
ncbi:MAG: hypothetical protein OEL57_16220, partial [Trichlorobacter sp.]|uniref:hypothetical protein n=1 Tax=Trichlorobacter sp. TaxID=2911007 RepID=UPI00256321AE